MSDTLVGNKPNDPSKRTWIIASSCVGIAGAAATAVPFVSTFQPSERAKAAGAAVEVDISTIKPGEKITVEWRGKPVWVVRRTPEQLATLSALNGELAEALTPSPSANQTSSPPSMRATKRVPSSLNSWWPLAFAPIWAARHRTSSRPAPRLLCPTTGRAAFCALATVRPLTWLAASSRTSPRLTISKFRRICTFPTASC